MTDVMNYEDVAKKGWDELPEPQNLPNGSYRFTCRGAKIQPPKSEKGNPSVVFTYQAQEPMDDVDEDALRELGEDYDITANMCFHRFWIERLTDWHKVKKHIEAHGVDLSGKNIEEGLKAMKNVDVIAFATTQTFTNKTTGESRTENVLKNFTAIDA